MSQLCVVKKYQITVVGKELKVKTTRQEQTNRWITQILRRIDFMLSSCAHIENDFNRT